MKSNTILQDFMASIVVFLVALPLCMGIAIASGVDPAMGLLSGIVGGLIIGFLAGSPLQVSGPAAGLAVIVYETIQTHGLKTFAIVVFLAGLLQITAGALKIGQWFRAVAPSVIYAMLAGIGVLIFLSQFHVMMDLKPQASSWENLLAIPLSLQKGISPSAESSYHLAGFISLITLGAIVGWNFLRPRLPSPIAVIPAPLVAIVLATTAAALFQFPIVYVTVPDSLDALIQTPNAADFSSILNPSVIGAAVALAAVASAESLLCATALDSMHDGKPSNLNQELIAQGAGNTILGLLGGLPLTGVIVRSSANIEAGGKTRLSAILHGAWLLLMISLLPWVLKLIPVSALAAVLVFIGYKLVNVKAIKELKARGRGEILVYSITLACIVFINLLNGLVIGLILSVIHLASKSSKLAVDVQASEQKTDVFLHGSATFLVLNHLVDEINQVPTENHIHLHLENLGYIDHACLRFIQEWEEQIHSQGGTVVLEKEALEIRSKGLQITKRAS